MRAVKYYPPELRRYLQQNLQCIYCGNTSAFYMDMRLRQKVTVRADNSILIESSQNTQKILTSINNNILMILDNGKDVIHCANCSADAVDLQERLLDYCWQIGCAGCDVCGNYIDKEDVIETCMQCIKENSGKIEEEDCDYNCAYYENGLGGARAHHKISFPELKREAGY